MLTSFFASLRKPLPAVLALLTLAAAGALMRDADRAGEAAAVLAATGQEAYRLEDMEPVETVQVTATGYTAGVESTGKSPGEPGYGITYSGVKVRRDHVSTIAADPHVFPIGTLLFIPGYGYGVVADTGSAIKGRKIDLYFETTAQVYKNWGKRTVSVDVIRRGDGKLDETWLEGLNEAVGAGKPIPQRNVAS